jgi:ribosomal protein S18 acetylase RimI-like enzyme
MPFELRLRTCETSDREFLLRIYASTRAEELALVPWPRAKVEAFILMQFEAQDRHYRAHFEGAAFSVVLLSDDPVGRLIVHRDARQIVLVDIALLPEFRSRGIGTELLTGLIEEADEGGLPLRCHVDPDSRARQLYERLGFVPTGVDDYRVAMERPYAT